MRKLIVIILVLLLTGCGTSSEGTGINKDKNKKELSKMETLLKQDKYDEIFFNFHKNYKDSNKKPTQKEIELYNKVVLTISKKDIEKYFSSYDNLALKDYISDKTKDKLDEFTNKKIDELKNDITSAINNKSFEEIQRLDNKSNSLQKKDGELRSMVAYGLYLRTYYMEDTFDSNGKLYVDSSGMSLLSHAIYNVQVNVSPDYTGKYSEKLSKIALQEIPELKNTDDYMNYSEEQWLEDYNKANNIEFKEMEMKDIEIGMTQEEVINQTKWGKPQEINKTTSSYGVNEQWVYPDFKYLYFEDGILTVIQE